MEVAAIALGCGRTGPLGSSVVVRESPSELVRLVAAAVAAAAAAVLAAAVAAAAAAAVAVVAAAVFHR